METPLLQTKFYIPPLRPEFVPRPRLIGRLNEGLHRKLTLVSAPAGFGKTTLVSSWVNDLRLQSSKESQIANRKSKIQNRVAWLSLDESDNDAIRFLTYLVAALQTIEPTMSEAILAALQSPQPPPIETTLTALLNDINTLPDNIILVLDDYHIIETQAVDETLTFLLEHLPPQMHLVITTREDPNWPLARYRARGQLTELRAAELRFSPAEATTFFNQAMGLNLTAADIEALETRTEGWIAGLQLAALSIQGRADPSRFIQAFTGRHHFVLDYLIEEVLHQQPDAVRNFLLKTAILERLTPSLCNAVTGYEDSQGMLATLTQNNMFIIPLDDERQWYRYHHLFAEVLLARLMDEQASQVSTLHQRASAWYEQNGLWAEAIHHALAAEDFGRAADLVELTWPGLHRSNFLSPELLGWLAAIPDDFIRARPVLSVGYAWELLNSGQFESAEAHLQDAERWMALTDNTAADPASMNFEIEGLTMVVGDEAEFRLLPTEIASARAYLAQALGDAPGTITYAQRALELIPEDDHIRRGPAASLLGLAYWKMGKLERAYDALAEGMASFQRAGNILFAIAGTFGLAEMQLAQGQLETALTIYQKAIQLALNQGNSALPGMADLYLGLSEVYREQNKLAEAETHLLKSQELNIHPGQNVYEYHWRLVQARQKQNQGDWDDALRLLDEAEDLFTQIHIPDFKPAAAMKAQLWLAQGQLAKALRWVQERGLSVDDDLSYLNEFEHITLARVLVAQYQQEQDSQAIHQAIALLERLLSAAEQGERKGSVIQILILQALAYAAQADSASALISLERALNLAEPEGYVRIFVDEGASMARLLSQARRQGIAPTYTNKLLAAFPNFSEKESPPSRSRPQNSALLEPLSERELEVLRLIAQGKKNQEIAEALLISLNTVRYHTKNLYGKLGVNKRTQAVAKAR
ncbi:MAG: helix-turn-helix transcriptional regulator, partial [Chloroflexi bacterium]